MALSVISNQASMRMPQPMQMTTWSRLGQNQLASSSTTTEPSTKVSISSKAASIDESAGNAISSATSQARAEKLQASFNAAEPFRREGLRLMDIAEDQRKTNIDDPINQEVQRTFAKGGSAFMAVYNAANIQNVQTPDAAQSNIRDADSAQSAPPSRQLLAQQASASMFALNAQQQPQQPVLSLFA